MLGTIDHAVCEEVSLDYFRWVSDKNDWTLQLEPLLTAQQRFKLNVNKTIGRLAIMYI